VHSRAAMHYIKGDNNQGFLNPLSLAFSPSVITSVTSYAFGEYGFPTFGFLHWPRLAGSNKLHLNQLLLVSFETICLYLNKKI